MLGTRQEAIDIAPVINPLDAAPLTAARLCSATQHREALGPWQQRAPSATPLEQRAPSAEPLDQPAPSADPLEQRAPSADPLDQPAPSATPCRRRAPSAIQRRKTHRPGAVASDGACAKIKHLNGAATRGTGQWNLFSTESRAKPYLSTTEAPGRPETTRYAYQMFSKRKQ